ncbi:MAG: peptide deformylase [Lachnospiraceae bacterium]|nr:peptide deformylase [Lachnospiraceae bacterium]
MALRQIRVDGDDILRKKCKEVKEMTERTRILIDDMFETMYETNGVGLAAPQVGILKRLVVIDVDYETPLVLINPVIIEREGEQTGDEGCLSLPGKVAVVTRPSRVVCRCLNEEMEEIEIEGEGLLARAICHELDHLDGILYKDVADGPLRDVDYDEEDEFEDLEDE